MSREIDPQAIEDQTLSWAEAEYLRVRGQLPENYPHDPSADPEKEDPPEDGDEYLPSKATPLEEQTVPLMEEDDEEKADYLPGKAVPLEEQSVPVMGNRGGIVDDDSDYEGVGSDYSKEEGWNQEKRRTELAKRGLSVSGRMDDLISRLRRSDSGELSEDDYEATEDEDESDEDTE